MSKLHVSNVVCTKSTKGGWLGPQIQSMYQKYYIKYYIIIIIFKNE